MCAILVVKCHWKRQTQRWISYDGGGVYLGEGVSVAAVPGGRVQVAAKWATK